MNLEAVTPSAVSIENTTRIEDYVTVRIKWYSHSRQYGFALLSDGTEIYVPFYAVHEASENANISRLDPETTMVVRLAYRGLRIEVKKIFSVDASTAIVVETKSNMSDAPAGPIRRENGEIKWYDQKLGYGFITLSDGTDTFLHRNVVRDSDLDPQDLENGRQVAAEIYAGARGKVARRIELR